MSERDDFDRVFTEELSALDAFFDERAEKHEHFKLGRQDPDVRRILEAVAFFSARTRRLAAANVRAAVERLVRGQLDDLLSPLPAAGMLLARVNERLGGPAFVPEGTEVQLTAPDGTVGVFTTRRRLDVLPLGLSRLAASPDGKRLEMRLDAWIGLRGPMPALRFHLDVRGSYRESRRLLAMLQSHVRSARVAYDDDPPGEAIEASFTVGAPPPPAEGDGLHPLARIRSFFQLPAQDLYFSVTLPTRRAPWKRASVYLELEGEAPRDLLRVGKQAFQLFAVPIENALRRDAVPILCDGTKDSYAIRDARAETASAGREARAVLCSVEGVYRDTKRGRMPIVPGLVADTDAVYDLLLVRPDEDPEGLEPRVALRIPGAFEKPCKVIVDARWYQPSFDASAAGTRRVALPKRHLEGVQLELAGDLCLSQKSSLVADAPQLLHVMALRTRVSLTRDELASLLRCLGASDRGSHYRRLLTLLKEVRVEEAPGAAGQGKKRVYTLEYQRDDLDFEALVRDGLVAAFEDQVAALLEAWIADDVELRRFADPLPGEARRPALRMVTGGGS